MSECLKAEEFTLNDGNKMPAVGLGTFQGNYDYKVEYSVLINYLMIFNNHISL